MKKIIIDADPGIDDSIAIMLASAVKDYDILGITLVSGNVCIDKCVKNVLRLSKFLEKDFNIYKSIPTPLVKDLINAEDTHGEDGLGETYLEYDKIDVNDNAVDFILDSLKEDEITIFALGPLTNIARAMKKDKIAFENARIISMGGNFKSFGNMSPVAEFNYYVDSDAADYVIQNAPNTIEIVPLDVTRKFVLTPNIIALMKRMNSKIANFIQDITNFYMDFHYSYENIIGSVINDPLVIMAEKYPELFTKNKYHADVILDGPARGMLMVDEKDFLKKETNIILYTDIKLNSVWKEFLEIITQKEVDCELLEALL